MINMILCGGSGTRLWPLSRGLMPKQFVRLFDGSSLYQQTLQRNSVLCAGTLVVVNSEQYLLALDQASQNKHHNARYVLEPMARNTAAAIALACLALDEDDLVLVTPSDHLIKNQHAYQDAVLQAKALAQQDYLVTFGIQPTYAETGFGYIEAQGQDVLSFKEKPNAERAAEYVASGNYYWNSGMFCFKAGVLLQQLKQCEPKIYDACVTAFSADLAGKVEMRIDRAAMSQIPELSIDYAVMEKSQRVKVVPCDIAWSDLGSFDSLYQEFKKESVDNVVLQQGEQHLAPVCVNSHNNLLVCNDRQLSLVDIEGLLVVDTPDALLIARQGSSQEVKQIVATLKQRTSSLTEVHRLAHRPWGTYEVLQQGDHYKVKRIVVKPSCKLSLQKHFHRNEHWIVVSGTALVTVDEQQFLVRPNESTYIKMGQVHRLENCGKIDLVMIEVQVGEYTGEDDIVRIDDVYGRSH